jgi:predicted Fe-S protein YdhL (DUF1289 family)
MEKLAELERELRMRRHVYPGLVERARPERRAWIKAECDERIAVLEQIAEDYRQQVSGDPGPLFRKPDQHQEQTS